MRCGLSQQDLARVTVRLVHLVRLNRKAMPPQHGGRSFEAGLGLVADRAQNHAFGGLQEGEWPRSPETPVGSASTGTPVAVTS